MKNYENEPNSIEKSYEAAERLPLVPGLGRDVRGRTAGGMGKARTQPFVYIQTEGKSHCIREVPRPI